MNGLLKKPAAFISAAWRRISGTAERTITGSCANSGSLSCFARNCQPSITGIIKSRRITQGAQSVLSFSSPSSPFTRRRSPRAPPKPEEVSLRARWAGLTHASLLQNLSTISRSSLRRNGFLR